MPRPTLALVAVVLVGCAHNVAQDRATGADGRVKGARAIVLDEGEGKARGIVTYPGGDRVDWKSIELPAGKRGTLDLEMTYRTPRPGLRVAFDVFDQYNAPVGPASGGRGRIRSAKIDGAMGKYFVRVYAPRRGDAGSYTLTAAFHPDIVLVGVDPLKLDIPLPPKLAAVPDPTCDRFDATDPACKDKCPPDAPKTWIGCPKDPAATAVTPPVVPATPPPAPVVAPKPVTGRVVKREVTNDGIEVTIAGGSASGVDKSWRAQQLRGETSALLPGAVGSIVRVNKTTTVVLLRTTSDLVMANPYILLSP